MAECLMFDTKLSYPKVYEQITFNDRRFNDESGIFGVHKKNSSQKNSGVYADSM